METELRAGNTSSEPLPGITGHLLTGITGQAEVEATG